MKSAVAAVLLLLGAAAPARADLVYPKGGGAPVEGRVEDDGKSPDVTVHLPGGGSLRFPRARIARIEARTPPQDECRERRGNLDPADVEGRVALAKWCQAKGLRQDAEALFREVLDRAPEHPEALSALGYVLEQGIWMLADEAHVARGDRKLGDRWLGPEAYRAEWTRAGLERFQKEGPAAREGVRKALLASPDDLDPGALGSALKSRSTPVRQLALAGLRETRVPGAEHVLAAFLAAKAGADHEAEALEALLAHRAPGVASTVMGFLPKAEDDAARLRLVKALGLLKDPAPVQVLAGLALFGKDFPLRQEAGRALGTIRSAAVLEAFCTSLPRASHAQRERLAEALTAYGDIAAVPHLILALEIRLREQAGTEVEPQPMNLQFQGNNLGPGGFSDAQAFGMLGLSESGRRADFDSIPPEVRALEKLTGQAFGTHAVRWRTWWESRR